MGCSASSTPISSPTTFIGSGWAKTVFRSTTPSLPCSASASSSSSVNFSMSGRIASSRRGVRAWEVFVRSRRCSAPSTVNMERPASIMPISGQAWVTSPLCHSPQASRSFTRRVSMRSWRASACRVTVQAGTPRSSMRASGTEFRSCSVSPSRSWTMGSITTVAWGQFTAGLLSSVRGRTGREARSSRAGRRTAAGRGPGRGLRVRGRAGGRG